jgi:hypothetical protein
MIFYLVVFVILLISYYIYKNYCKENFDNCAGPTTTETPTTKGSCDLTNFSESPHRAEGPVPIGDYQAYLPGCPATNQYPVLNAYNKPICRRCWNGTVAYPPTIQSAIELTTDSPCNMYDLLKPGTNDGGYIPWNPAPSPAGEGERWPSWEGDIYKGSGLITKDCKVQRPKCVCNPGWSGENCSWKKEIDINWEGGTFFEKISRILGYALIKKNYLQGITAAEKEKGKWDIEKSSTLYDKIGLATWNGKDAAADREGIEDEIKTTIKNAIINANTRLANTMNGKTQWFLFSNIFFTEPWEGGADWTGLTTYYIDEAWEILTSPNDAINTDHEAVSGWKMEQAEGIAIENWLGRDLFNTGANQSLQKNIEAGVIASGNNAIIGLKGEPPETISPPSFDSISPDVDSGELSPGIAPASTGLSSTPSSCLNSGGSCKVIESMISFCSPSPSCNDTNISKLSIIIDNTPSQTELKKLLFCLALEEWGKDDVLNISEHILENMPKVKLRKAALWKKPSNNSDNIISLLQEAGVEIYKKYKTQLCYTQLYSRLYTFHLRNLINEKGCELYANMSAVVLDIPINQEDYYKLFVDDVDVLVESTSAEQTCSSSESACSGPSENTKESNHEYAFGILNFYYDLKNQEYGDITNGCLDPADKTRSDVHPPSPPTPPLSEKSNCSIQKPNEIVYNNYITCQDVIGEIKEEIAAFLVQISDDITPAVIKRILDAANITEKTLDYQTTIIKELEIIIPKYITTRSDWYTLPIYNKYSAVEEISNHLLHSTTANLNDLLEKKFGNERFFLTKNDCFAPPPGPIAPGPSPSCGLNFGYDTYKNEIIGDCKNMCTGELAKTECDITNGVGSTDVQANCSPPNCGTWCNEIVEEGKGKWLIDFNINGEKNENDYELRLKLIEKIRREKATHGETERMGILKQNIEVACAPSSTGSPSPACIELTDAYKIAERGEAERAYQEERCVLDTEKGKWYAKIGYGGVNEVWNNEISKMTGQTKKCVGVGGGRSFVVPPSESTGYQNPNKCSMSPNDLSPEKCYAELTYSPSTPLEQCIHSPSSEVCDREYRKASLEFERKSVLKRNFKCNEGTIANATKISWANGYNECSSTNCEYPSAYVGSQISVECKDGYVATPSSGSMCSKNGASPAEWENIECVSAALPAQKIEEDEKEYNEHVSSLRQQRNILSLWTVEESSAVSQVGLLNNDFNGEESQELIPEKKEEKSLFDKISQFRWF